MSIKSVQTNGLKKCSNKKCLKKSQKSVKEKFKKNLSNKCAKNYFTSSEKSTTQTTLQN